jgi:hypothetical protein
MLVGVEPFESWTSASCSEPFGLMRRTEMSLLAGSVARRYRPSLDSWSPPADPNAAPVPAPPASNGEPGIGVSEPSAWRSKPSIVFWPVVLPLT